MSGRKKSSDESRSKSPDNDVTTGKKEKSRRSGRRREDGGGASVSSEDAQPRRSSLTGASRRASGTGATPPATTGTPTNTTTGTSSSRRSGRKEAVASASDDDSKVSHSTRGSSDSKVSSSKQSSKEKRKSPRKGESRKLSKDNAATTAAATTTASTGFDGSLDAFDASTPSLGAFGSGAFDLPSNAFESSSVGAFETAFSATAASSSSNNDHASADAFNFDTAAFSPKAKPKGAASSSPAFDTAFSTDTFAAFDDSAFGTGKTSSAFTGSSTAAAFDSSASVFSAKPETVWDTSPLTHVPTVPPKQFVLHQAPLVTKQFQGAPITNPANGNILACVMTTSITNEVQLCEINPASGMQVTAVPILSPQLRQKIASKYNATVIKVDTVWNLAAGRGGSSSGSKVSVAAICDVGVLESSTSMRVVLVWEWCGPGQVTLKYAMTPPSGGDFVCDVSTLCFKDGLFFVAGQSPKGACIFVSQPAVREAWSANFLTGGGTITAVSVAPTQPYLVVALTDESVTVWTYKSALLSKKAANAGGSVGGKSPTKRWLFPLCRLNHASALNEENPVHPGTDDGDDDDEAQTDQRVTSNVGHCCHLAWLPPDPSLSSLLILAVAFANGGFAIFHVDLPVIISPETMYHAIPEPTQSTVVTATPLLSPIAVKRWKGNHLWSSVSWVLYGPHVDPCLAVLLHDSAKPLARILLCAIHFPMYRRSPIKNVPMIRVLASTTVTSESTSFPKGLLQSFGPKTLCSYSTKSISSVVLSSSAHAVMDSSVAFLSHPISSTPPGLSSLGDPFLVDAASDKDGILYTFTLLSCERVKSSSDESMLNWSPPVRRNWLCCSVVGDTKETFVEETKEDRGFGDSEGISGGASSTVICELDHDDLAGLAPFRIVRCLGSKACAVLFRPSLGAKADVAVANALCLEADTIVLVDYSGEQPVVEVTTGRDLVFFPDGSQPGSRGVVLGADGTSLTFFTWLPSRSFELGTAFRPIVGVDNDKDYIDCRRIDVFSEGSKLSMAVVGKRVRDGRSCYVIGDLCDLDDATNNSWSKLLPNVVSGRSAWFKPGEDILSVTGLQGDGSGYRNFALSTSARIVILSSALTIAAQSPKHACSSNLAPLGSFAVCYSSDTNVRYLCCLDGDLAHGVVMSLAQSTHGRSQSFLLAVRPDRLLFCPSQLGVRLVELGQSADTFHLPVAEIRPALLLEPMVSNAVCVGGKLDQSTPALRSVMEKFGRKITSTTHGEREGIGSYGGGLTAKTFAILNTYKLNQAASWLLTGTVKFERSSNTRVLPPWLPIGPKSKGALNSDGQLHVLSTGDSYLTEYLKSPDMASTLPRQSDPIAYLGKEYAQHALESGNPLDALKIIDLAGNESSDSLALQLSLMLEKSKKSDSSGVLKCLSGFGDTGFSSSSSVKAPASLAALALTFKINAGKSSRQEMSVDQTDRWMKPLAPSLQRSQMTSRLRQRVFSTHQLDDVGGKSVDKVDGHWNTPCNESKHVWNEGPRKEKENLLMLDSVEDWLGRKRPLIFGKEGAFAAKERGETTLADILNQDDDSFGANKGDPDLESEKDDGWVDGVGEGRSDEANISGYFRMSEGDEEDGVWRVDGLMDLSPYGNKAFIIGDADSFSLQQSTSSVDEGEPGKVKSLYDLVFEKSGVNLASGLSLPAPRGGSLDIGVLHTSSRSSRKKCSLEFWYYLPPFDGATNEVILARRTIGSSADDLSKVGLASDKESVLWELVLRTSGNLEFRTCGGSKLSSSKSAPSKSATEDDDSDDEKERPDLATFERWNHVCVVLSSKGLKDSECSVAIYMKGIEVASGIASMMPPTFTESDLSSDSKLAVMMQKSHVLFGLNHSAGFRMTELRVWACERSADDTQSFMYEYLNAAEQKKKFKVKIANKNKKGLALGKGLGLAPPKGTLGASVSKPGGLAPPRLVPTKSGNVSGLSLAPPPQEASTFSLEPPKAAAQNPASNPPPVSARSSLIEDGTVDSPAPSDHPAKFDASFSGFGMSGADSPKQPPLATQSGLSEIAEDLDTSDPDDEDVATTLWDTALPLSQQIRPSAAAALIRGPPATRHYGGNRGGLPDFSGVERFGVGGIAICGSEKTIVFRDNEEPPALTYPIGASGAVVSDQMDDEGSEFLCCFLAKEGRMVVFELRSRTVVVELQMTTKLNYWRYLPPEAAENTLCFMLVTPVGGFHWMPLEEAPRPHQVWKRGPELHGKKVCSYEEGGSNGLDGHSIRSSVGLVLATRSSGGGTLEGWLLPISGDSQAQQASDDMLGACLCQPLFVEDGPFLPLLVTVHNIENGIWVNVLSITEPKKGSLAVGEVQATQIIDEEDIDEVDYEPPALAMGPLPEAICVSLSNIVVVILRRKGLVAAFELEEGELNLIAQERVDHFVIDAVMRYSAEIGGAEIVMLLSDDQNPKDGRIVSFCFRSAV